MAKQDIGTVKMSDAEGVLPPPASLGREQSNDTIRQKLHSTEFNYVKPGQASNVEILTRSTSIRDALTGLSQFLSNILSVRLDENDASVMAMEALAHVTKLVDGEQKVGRWGWSFLEDITQFVPQGLVQMRLKVINDDSFDCVTLKGGTEGTEEIEGIEETEGTTIIKVAKPPKFRKTDFDGASVDGVSYDYTTEDPHIREATDSEDATIEEQIIPIYTPGQTLYAMPVIGSPGLPDEAEFIEMNVDGRYWAQTAFIDDE